MIFATCGSSHFRFDRMMEALAALPPHDLYVQHGPAEPPPHARAVEFLPFEKIVDNIARADVVISHAGVGSILCAIRAGHTPVIFPRLKRYNETVDDHQAELAQALSEQGSAVVAWEPRICRPPWRLLRGAERIQLPTEHTGRCGARNHPLGTRSGAHAP